MPTLDAPNSAKILFDDLKRVYDEEWVKRDIILNWFALKEEQGGIDGRIKGSDICG